LVSVPKLYVQVSFYVECLGLGDLQTPPVVCAFCTHTNVDLSDQRRQTGADEK